MSQPIYNIRASFLKIVQPQQVAPYGLYGDIGGSLVVLMLCPRVTLFFIFQARSKWSHYQLGCSEHQTHRGGHDEAGLLGRCPISRPLSRGPASSAIVRPAGWGCHRGKTAGCPQGYEGQGPFEVGRVATLWLRDPPSQNPTQLPHITYGHLQKLPLGALWLPDLGSVI